METNDKNSDRRAHAAARAIINDMEGRGGGDGWWGSIDPEIQTEIVDAWAGIIDATYAPVREAAMLEDVRMMKRELQVLQDARRDVDLALAHALERFQHHGGGDEEAGLDLAVAVWDLLPDSMRGARPRANR